MREHVLALRSLQRVDNEISEAGRAVEELGEQLDQLKQGIAFLRDELTRQSTQLEETRHLRSEHETALKTHEEALNRARSRVSGIKRTQEYMAIQREQENARKSIAGKEEEILKILEVEQATIKALDERRVRLEGLEKQARSFGRTYRKQKTAADATVSGLEAERVELLAGLPRPLTRKYERIRERRGGVAVAEAIDEACTGCHMGIPPQLYNNLQRGEALVACPSCQRILYFAGEPAVGPPAPA